MTEQGFRVEQDLQNDRKLDGVKLIAGLLSVGVLVAMFIMPLNRAPDPAWSGVLAGTAAALTALIALGVARGRRHGRFWSVAPR